jgi:hypothetical protein
LFTRPAVPIVEFMVTAYVKNADGQTVSLEMPPHLVLIRGPKRQMVQSRERNALTRISWVVMAPKRGEYILRARLSDGTTDTKSVWVLVGCLFEPADPLVFDPV